MIQSMISVLPIQHWRHTSTRRLSRQSILIVNTASKCGFTPQYEGLQALHDKYQEQGLVTVAMPCNQFGAQEPGSDADHSRILPRQLWAELSSDGKKLT